LNHYPLKYLVENFWTFIVYVEKIIFFYAFINYISEDQITRDAGDFRLIDRRVLDKVIALNDINPYIRGLSSAFATREVGVSYKRERRRYGRSKFPILNLIKHASDGIFSMTLFPLRLAGRVSFLISFVTIVLASYYFISAIFFGRDWPGGFATLVLLLLFGISLNAGFLAILGKYMGSIYLQQQNRPIVIVEQFINVDPKVAVKVEKI
jgi:dolichol-phosphate mannosyltransferase